MKKGSMGLIENAILQGSKRGMDRLARHFPEDYCASAAAEIVSWKRGTVLITTGFIVDGRPETDGPLGAIVLGQALRSLGFDVVIVTEEACCKALEPFGIDCVSVSPSISDADLCALADRINPVGAISIERCGRNSSGDYLTMSGVSVGEYTAPIDDMLKMLGPNVPLIGIGDGGNEIGMGNVRDIIISEELPISPCVVRSDILVIATVSNWAAYGIVAYLELLTGLRLLPSRTEVSDMLDELVGYGCIDGITRRREPTVDGFKAGSEREVVELLGSCVRMLSRLAS